MKRVRLSNKVRRTPGRSSGGFTLIEVLVALALFGIIAITFLGGLTTASRAVFTGDVRTTAESLARTQMEYVKTQGYALAPPGGEAVYSKITAIPEGYTICSVNRDDNTVNCEPHQDIIAVPWDTLNNKAAPTDDDLQRIKLIIKHEDRYIFSLEGYKVDR
jgi:prepilin-type N-terminal cleavage/methylation domain-containing protein